MVCWFSTGSHTLTHIALIKIAKMSNDSVLRLCTFFLLHPVLIFLFWLVSLFVINKIATSRTMFTISSGLSCFWQSSCQDKRSIYVYGSKNRNWWMLRYGLDYHCWILEFQYFGDQSHIDSSVRDQTIFKFRYVKFTWKYLRLFDFFKGLFRLGVVKDSFLIGWPWMISAKPHKIFSPVSQLKGNRRLFQGTPWFLLHKNLEFFAIFR